ncbi:MAG: acyl-CoA dehydrogenase, partial [Rhizorhabdus sp.]
QAGGIAAVFDQVRGHLVEQGRAEDPIQSGRLAGLYLAAQAAADAVAKAARCWDGSAIPSTLAHVAAARVAVYQAGEQALTLAQAAVGLQAMFVDHPLAATLTDLAVYLRQPGPDAQRARTGQAVASGLLAPNL